MKIKIKNKKGYYVAKKRWMFRVSPFLLAAIFMVGFWGTAFPMPPEAFDSTFDRPRFKEGRHTRFSPEERETVRKRINLIKIWRLSEELDLSEEKADKLFPVIRRFDKEKLELEKERNELMKNLRENLKKGKSKDTKLKKIIIKLEENYAALQNLKKEKFNEMKDILSVEEQVKLILFMEYFPKEIRSIIGDAKRKERERRVRGFLRE